MSEPTTNLPNKAIARTVHMGAGTGVLNMETVTTIGQREIGSQGSKEEGILQMRSHKC
jgi:hypothetical protein